MQSWCRIPGSLFRRHASGSPLRINELWRNPMNRLARTSTAIAVLFILALALTAQVPEREGRPQETRPATGGPRLSRACSQGGMVRHRTHSEVGQSDDSLQSSAGTTLLHDDAGEPNGLLYSVAYTRTDVKDLSARPVAFLYNGGRAPRPCGSTSGIRPPARVHPRRPVHAPGAVQAGRQRREPAGQDRPGLHRCDGTGYSRLAGKATTRDFYGIDEDVRPLRSSSSPT